MSEHSWLLICSGTRVYGGGGQHRPVHRALARGEGFRRDHSSEIVRGGLSGRLKMWHSSKIVFVCWCCKVFALSCFPAVRLKFHCLLMIVLMRSVMLVTVIPALCALLVLALRLHLRMCLWPGGSTNCSSCMLYMHVVSGYAAPMCLF